MPKRYLYSYEVSPMDAGWSRLPTVPEYLKRVAGEFHYENSSPRVDAIEEILNFVKEALRAGHSVGWEGDFKQYGEPRVVVLPHPDEPRLALAWQQDNNGTTFVVSEVPMPWLE
jgi:hypothetical protein